MVNKKNWKAITLNHSDLQSYDDNDIVICCLTQRSVAILKSLLTTAYWVTRWTERSGVSDGDLIAYVAGIDAALDGNDCEVLMLDDLGYRENPDDICQVEYTIDGGAVWLPMFRKDNCQTTAIGASPADIDIAITTINDTDVVYAGDITNVAPNWEVGVMTDKALCFAIKSYVDSICEFRLTQMTGNEGALNTADMAQNAINIFGGIAIGIAVPTGGISLIAGTAAAWALALTGVLMAQDAIETNGRDTYKNEDARETIACLMYSNLMGLTPTFDNWKISAFGGVGLTADELAIQVVVHTANKSEDLFVQYLIMQNEIVPVSPQLPDCPCDDMYSHYWNFETHAGAWGDGLFTVDNGNYEVGIGVTSIDRANGVDTARVVEQVVFGSNIDTSAVRFTIWARVVKGAWRQDETALILDSIPNDRLEYTQSRIATGNLSFNTDDFALTPTELRLATIKSGQAVIGDLGSVTLVAFSISGIGTDPYILRSTGEKPTGAWLNDIT